MQGHSFSLQGLLIRWKRRRSRRRGRRRRRIQRRWGVGGHAVVSRSYLKKLRFLWENVFFFRTQHLKMVLSFFHFEKLSSIIKKKEKKNHKMTTKSTFSSAPIFRRTQRELARVAVLRGNNVRHLNKRHRVLAARPARLHPPTTILQSAPAHQRTRCRLI